MSASSCIAQADETPIIPPLPEELNFIP